MVSIPLTDQSILNVKHALRQRFPGEKSSHLTEALAAACGYRNHASLLAQVRQSNPGDPEFVLLNDGELLRRLHELGGNSPPRDTRASVFEHLAYSDPTSVIRTESKRGRKFKYGSARMRAWRNLMVAGINAGIDQRLFTVSPGDNRWPKTERMPVGVFRFLVGDIPAVASVSDAGWDELSIHVAFWPTEDGARHVVAMNAGFYAGEVFASGWLERRDGAWLQSTAGPDFCCRKKRLHLVASLEVTPKGYADRGDFKL